MRSIASVKMDCILLRAFPGLCHGSPHVTCAREEFGDRVWLGGVFGCQTKSPCLGKGRVGAAVPRARRPWGRGGSGSFKETDKQRIEKGLKIGP